MNLLDWEREGEALAESLFLWLGRSLALRICPQGLSEGGLMLRGIAPIRTTFYWSVARVFTGLLLHLVA